MFTIRSSVLLLALALSLVTSAAAQPLSGPEFIPLATPCRALDTRVTGTPVPANEPTTIQISGVTTGGTNCGVPSTAVGAALNFTITEPQGFGYMTAWPSGSLPLASVVNFVPGETVANAVDMGLGAGGRVIVQPIVTTHLVVDIYGYFTDVEELQGDNTALGVSAFASNTTGVGNTAIGVRALGNNTTGSNNTAIGVRALSNHTTGSANIAIGFNAGAAVTTGFSNIHIGHPGNSGDSDVIRIGLGIQKATFIAGIRSVTTGVNDALAVLIDSAGQLGTASSSRRVKTDIHDLGDQSRALHQLRPVSFRYRSHPPDGPLEYGLIAEEVAEIYPDLVVRDKGGQPSGVRYHVLPAMLLNEVQKQHAQLQEQTTRLDVQQREIDELRAQVRALIGGKAAVRE